MKLSNIFDVNIGLSVVPAAVAGFSVPLLLVDHADIPIDRRYIITDADAYATDLTASSDAEEWCTTLWAQSMGGPSQAYIGRWISTASSPHFICGDHQTTIATWQGVTAGRFAVQDNTSPTPLKDEITCGTMGGVTSIAGVCAVMQAGLAAIAGDPNISGLKTATVALDALGRIVLTNSTTGAAAKTVTIVAPSSGTDITGAGFLDVADGITVPGYAAEDLDDALAAVLAKDNSPFIICQRGGSIAQKVALDAACAVYKKVCELVDNDANSKDATKTSDVAYQLHALAAKNTHITYTEFTTHNPDAAICGECYVRLEGTANIARIGLSSVSRSGKDPFDDSAIEMTSGEETALEDKGCDWLGMPVNVVHLSHGLTCGGVEMRHRIGLYWAEARASEDGYATLLAMAGANKAAVFSDEDISALAAPIKRYLDILVDRKVIEGDYVLNLPAAADISATIKATHTLSLADMATLTAQYAINNVDASLVALV